jgi:broad specificity phosphatase PhoE
MENERHIFTPESQERFGRNVEIHAVFVRHGEKGEGGELTEEGKNQAAEFGEQLEKKDAVKGYVSPVQRAIETVERIIESSPHDKKLKTRIRTEIGIPPSSKEFYAKFKELEKQGPDAAAEWFLSFGAERPDTETASPHEVAESFAYVLAKYLRMADKLYSGSNIDLVNGTHQGLPESLLKEVLKRKMDDKEVIGFDKIEDIGGALRFTEGMEFVVKTDSEGNKRLTVNFRGQGYDIDMAKLDELAKSYAEKQKQN